MLLSGRQYRFSTRNGVQDIQGTKNGFKLAKKGNFSPFQSLNLQEEKLLTFIIWLNESLVLPS